MSKALASGFALIAGILFLIAMSWLLSDFFITSSEKVDTKERLYEEIRYKVEDWDLDEDKGLLTIDRNIIIDTNERSLAFDDHFARYVISEKDYSYVVEIKVSNTDGTPNLTNPKYVVAFTTEDLKSFSSWYSREFEYTLKMHADSYDKFMEDYIAQNGYKNYIRKTIDRTSN